MKGLRLRKYKVYMLKQKNHVVYPQYIPQSQNTHFVAGLFLQFKVKDKLDIPWKHLLEASFNW